MTELDRLLLRLRDGEGDPALLDRARALLREDVRLPQDLRDHGLDDDDPALAAGALLGVLGLDGGLFGALLGEALLDEASLDDTEAPWAAGPPDWPRPAAEPEPLIDATVLAAQEAAGLPPVGEAVRRIAGEVELADAVLRAVGAAPAPPLAAAVRAMAGEAQVADAVVTRLGVPPLPVGRAVRHLAGDIEIAPAVLALLGDAGLPVAEAVRDEAGEPRLASASPGAAPPVADAVRTEAGVADLTDAVMARLEGARVPDPASVPLDAPIAEAVRERAGQVDLAPAVLARLGAAELPLREAIEAEAGTVDVAGELAPALAPTWLSALLDHELPPAAHRLAARRLMREPAAAARTTALADQAQTLRRALADEAGPTPYVWGPVAPRIGLAEPEAIPGYDGDLVAEAVRAQAGPVRIADGVMDRIAEAERAARVPVEAAAPAAANHNRWWQTGAVVLAAALVLVLVGGRLLPLLAPEVGPEAGPEAPLQVPDFAARSEVSVEELSYDEDVDVFVQFPEEAGGRPLIFGANEGA